MNQVEDQNTVKDIRHSGIGEVKHFNWPISAAGGGGGMDVEERSAKDIREDLLPMWSRIQEDIGDEISSLDQKVLGDITSSKSWLQTIPGGLVASYSYIYEASQGLSTHEASIIERDVLRTIGAVKDGYSLFRRIEESGKCGFARSMRRLLTSVSLTDGMGYCQGKQTNFTFI